MAVVGSLCVFSIKEVFSFLDEHFIDIEREFIMGYSFVNIFFHRCRCGSLILFAFDRCVTFIVAIILYLPIYFFFDEDKRANVSKEI